IASSGNTVVGNFIGSDTTGTLSRGSGCQAINVAGGNNTIGGTSPGDRNLITGGGAVSCGVNMDLASNNNHVLNNYLGTNAGGTAAGAGNRIAFNSGNGVDFPANVASTGNAVLGNELFSNGGLPIDLNDDGVTANDACDADTGPNNLQNFPVITSVTAGAGST